MALSSNIYRPNFEKQLKEFQKSHTMAYGLDSENIKKKKKMENGKTSLIKMRVLLTKLLGPMC